MTSLLHTSIPLRLLVFKNIDLWLTFALIVKGGLSSVSMASTVPPSTITFDLPCPRCGYNLRGLYPAGTCPECALKIELALGEKFFRFASVRWLKTLLWAIGCEMAWLILLPGVLILASMSSPMSPFLLVVNGVFFAIACLLLTIAGPFLRTEVFRWPLRVCGLLSLLGMMSLAGFWLQNVTWLSAPFSVGLLFLVPALLIKAYMLRKLTIGFPSQQAESFIILAMVFWFILISSVLCIITAGDMMFTQFGVAYWTFGPIVILILIAFVAYLAALAQFFQSVSDELRFAKTLTQR